MFRQRSAVKPSECETIANKFKKKARCSSRYYQRSKISILCHVQKKINAGALPWHLKTFGLDFKYIKANTRNLIFYFIKCSLGTLYYI